MTLALCLGIYFRVAPLGERVFWVDEVATAIRIAGQTKQDVQTDIATGQVVTVAHLQQLQHIQHAGLSEPSVYRSWSDTVTALVQSPEHAPLYFLLTRAWLHLWGYPSGQRFVVVIRSLSVVFSLLTIPLLYWRSQQLAVESPTGATVESAIASIRKAPLALAPLLFTLSPFCIAYAQEARPYSLWMMELVLLNATLWRALHRNRLGAWVHYCGVLCLTLYTSLLTLLVLAGQAVYVGVWAIITPHHRRRTWRYGMATAIALLLFSPWIGVVVHHWHHLQANTVWMRSPLDFGTMVAVWIYSVVILFFDVPVSVDLSWTTVVKGLVALAIVGLMLRACLTFGRRLPAQTSSFVLASAGSTPLLLVLIDIVRSGQASATSRYLMPAQIGVLVVVAFYLNRLEPMAHSPPRALQPRPLSWRSMGLIGLLGLSVLSCTIGVTRIPDYQKAHNRFNKAIARVIQHQPSASSAHLVAEASHILDVLSLSYDLSPQTTVQVIPAGGDWSRAGDDWMRWDQGGKEFQGENPWGRDRSACTAVYFLHPSAAFRTALQQTLEPFADLGWTQRYRPPLLTPDDVHLSLWQLTGTDSDPCFTVSRDGGLVLTGSLIRAGPD